MQIAKTRIPHFTYVEEVDVSELERLRAQLNQDHADRESRLTVLPFLMRAVVVATGKHGQPLGRDRRLDRPHGSASGRARTPAGT